MAKRGIVDLGNWKPAGQRTDGMRRSGLKFTVTVHADDRDGLLVLGREQAAKFFGEGADFERSPFWDAGRSLTLSGQYYGHLTYFELVPEGA